MKLKMIKSISSEDCPDHLLQEIQNLSMKMSLAFQPVFQDASPNLILSSLNYFHAAMIKFLVSDKKEELENSAKMSAFSLIKNMDVLINLMERENEK